MKLKRLAQRLESIIDTPAHQRRKQLEALEKIKTGLEKKRDKFTARLVDAKSEKELKRLNRKIRAAEAQIVNADQAIKDLLASS